MRVPSGLYATDSTQPPCPSPVHTASPLAASQTRTVLSSLPDTMRVPSGLYATDVTSLPCPSAVHTADTNPKRTRSPKMARSAAAPTVPMPLPPRPSVWSAGSICGAAWSARASAAAPSSPILLYSRLSVWSAGSICGAA